MHIQDPAEWQRVSGSACGAQAQTTRARWRSSKLPEPIPIQIAGSSNSLTQGSQRSARSRPSSIPNSPALPVKASSIDSATRDSRRMEFPLCASRRTTNLTAHRLWTWPSMSTARAWPPFDFSAGARVTFMDVAHRGGEWRNDLLFGSSNLAATEFYQPLGQSRFFVAPYAFASKYRAQLVHWVNSCCRFRRRARRRRLRHWLQLRTPQRIPRRL